MKKKPTSIRLQELRDAIGFPPDKLALGNVEQYLADPNCYSLVEGAFYDNLPAILKNHLPEQGDLVVCGVWRGGSSLYVQAINQWQDHHRDLWLFDTFAGFHREEFSNPKDLAFLQSFNLNQTYRFPTPGEVRALFIRHELWTNKVHLVEGQLQGTLPRSGVSAIAFLHLDVDFYKPTLDALQLSYARLTEGAIILVDDYGVPEFGCREAVDTFRASRGITAPLHFLNDHMAYWIHHG